MLPTQEWPTEGKSMKKTFAALVSAAAAMLALAGPASIDTLLPQTGNSVQLAVQDGWEW